MEAEQIKPDQTAERFAANSPPESRVDMEIRRTLQRAAEATAFYHGQATAFAYAIQMFMYALTVSVVMIMLYRRYLVEK